MSGVMLLQEPTYGARERHERYSDAKTLAQRLAKTHPRRVKHISSLGRRKRPRRRVPCSQDGTGGERLFTTEQLDVLDPLRLLCRAALRLGRNTSISSSPPDSTFFFFFF